MPPSKSQVLVVDDDSDIRDAIRCTLEDEGYEAVEASDGQAALDYLRSNPAPPLILLDWNMAPMNGAQFMVEASKDPKLSQIPVILLTADARVGDKSKTNGLVGYLAKPVNLDAMFEIIRRYCDD